MNSRAGRAILAGPFVATVLGWSSLPGSRIGWTVPGATTLRVLAVWCLWTVMQRGGDAVVQHLATMPGRDEPRIQKLRRCLGRDVFFPARHRRDAVRPPGR